jgi:hypothetical protein
MTLAINQSCTYIVIEYSEDNLVYALETNADYHYYLEFRS